MKYLERLAKNGAEWSVARTGDLKRFPHSLNCGGVGLLSPEVTRDLVADLYVPFRPAGLCARGFVSRTETVGTNQQRRVPAGESP